jgi:NADPH-dependent ferric siderophore reductase
MGQDWKIRIQPAERTPYEFKATLLLRSAGDSSALDVSYLYGDGDLAVFLEDMGAAAPAICGLIEELHGRPTAEILVDVTEEAMEVLARRRPGARA